MYCAVVVALICKLASAGLDPHLLGTQTDSHSSDPSSHDNDDNHALPTTDDESHAHDEDAHDVAALPTTNDESHAHALPTTNDESHAHAIPTTNDESHAHALPTTNDESHAPLATTGEESLEDASVIPRDDDEHVDPDEERARMAELTRQVQQEVVPPNSKAAAEAIAHSPESKDHRDHETVKAHMAESVPKSDDEAPSHEKGDDGSGGMKPGSDEYNQYHERLKVEAKEEEERMAELTRQVQEEVVPPNSK